jgi:predicted metal-dependent HD superfamily phosphohydrolase
LKARLIGVYLLEDWAELVGEGHQDAGRRLLARWQEPHRRYHTADHLAAVLGHVTELQGKEPVRLAAWFHDAIYWPDRQDNEERSARLAQRTLSLFNIDPSTGAEVGRLVRLTLTHDPRPDDGNGAVLCDADLAILAAPHAGYRRYTEAIRAEYGHLDDATFTAGRRAVLQRLLGRRQLFHTPVGSQRWEAAGRANLRAELDALDGAAVPPPEA